MAQGHAGHSHTPQNFGRAFAWGIGLNTLYVVVEAVVGLASGSLGLVADAGHNASDVLSLIIAWAAARLAQRPPSERFTYGLKRSPIVASLFNALLLFGAMGIVFWEAFKRLQNPEPISGAVIIWVTLVGLVVNFGTAYLFAKGRGDLNIRGAFLHMMADGLVTLGVLLAGVLIIFTGAAWLDPVISLVIVAVVLWSTWGLFRDTMYHAALSRRGTGYHRPGSGARLSAQSPRRHRRSRFAHLGDEHHRSGVDGARRHS